MQATKDKVIIVDYTLKDGEGTVIDQSSDGNFAYLHGANNIIPGLESALEGKAAGDAVSVVIAPADGYGERDPEQVQNVPRNAFPDDVEIQPGMQFQAQSPDGNMVHVVVAEVEAESVTIDANHPLAGVTLHFDVNVVEVRDASSEELEHGHVHGPDGHEH